jgi:HEAT repeat protein
MDLTKPDPRSTEKLIQLALIVPEENDNGDDRWDFIWLLRYRGTRDVLDRAIALTESHNSEERTIGIQILGQLGIPDRTFPDESITTLIGLLQDETDPLILENIGIALGHLHDPRGIVPQLRFCLHPDWEVRYGVVCSLNGHNDERAIAALIQLSADEHPQVRNWATFGLGSLLEIDTPEIREALYQRFLLEDPKDEQTAEIYGEALLGLASRQDTRILPALIHELMSHDVGVLTIEATKALADPKLYPALLQVQTWSEPTGYFADCLADAIAACTPIIPDESDRQSALPHRKSIDPTT